MEVVRGEGTFSASTVASSPLDHFFSSLPLLPRGRTPKDLHFHYLHHHIHIFLYLLDCQAGVSPGLKGQELGQHQSSKLGKCCCWR